MRHVCMYTCMRRVFEMILSTVTGEFLTWCSPSVPQLKMVDYDHYRETSHMKLFDVSKMTEKATLGVKLHRGSCWRLPVLLVP